MQLRPPQTRTQVLIEFIRDNAMHPFMTFLYGFLFCYFVSIQMLVEFFHELDRLGFCK